MKFDVEKFLASNIELIEKEEFEKLYDLLTLEDPPILTEYMLNIGIDPLDHMSVVPVNYALGLPLTTVIIPSHIKNIYSFAYLESKVKKLIFEEGIESIGYKAFCKCRKLEKLELPDSLAAIGDNAFDDCTSLREVRLGKNVETIYSNAFQFCTQLSYFELNANIKEIDSKIFAECFQLKEIDYKGTKTMFENISKLGDWNEGSAIKIIHCTDGDIKL